MAQERTLILTHDQIQKKLERIAHHIHENHYKRKELHVVGLAERGYGMAERISSHLEKISGLKIHTHRLKLDKNNPGSTPDFSGDAAALKGNVVMLVDDVVNSGRTMIYATSFILDQHPDTLGTVALIDRIHRKFPIRVDYVGLTLSTNLKEHVSVEVTKKTVSAYLE